MITLPTPALRNWAKNNRLGAAHLQEPVDAINALLMSLASAQSDSTAPINAECWPGTIKATGPNGESAYTDERYWVQRTFIAGSVPNGQVVLQPDPLGGAGDQVIPTSLGTGTPNVFTVTNLLERKTHLHSIPPGIDVWVWASFDAGLTSIPGASGETASQPDNQKHYLMSVYARPVFKIAGLSTKPGTYTANPMGPPTAIIDPGSSSALAETDFGIANTAITVYLANIVEKGNATGHTQAAGAIIPGDFRGFASDGKPVFEIEAC